jgi:hypothetical protein
VTRQHHITAYIDGVHGDTNATFRRCRDTESRLLVERTHEAMMRGVKAVAPAAHQRHRPVIESARSLYYGVVRDSPARNWHCVPFRSFVPITTTRRHRWRWFPNDFHHRADAHRNHHTTWA